MKLNIKTIDMCHGSLIRQMIAYTIPLIFAAFLQLLYNAADLVVIGQFAGHDAFAAVGATTSLNSLFINLFIGISGGGCICVAQYYGARDGKNVSETVHTCVLFAVLCGIFVAVFSFFFVDDALQIMGTHEDIIDMSALYLRIVLGSAPFTLFYNFAAGIMRAAGDTKRPFYILVFTGMVNVLLNLLFVIVFHLSVAGVALATAIGSILNALIAGYLLTRSDDCIRIDIRRLHFHGDKLLKMLNYGIPSGMQSLLFNISNVIIQSAVNSFGSVAVVGGSAAASNIEGFIYAVLNSLSQTALNFSGQNYGARKYARVTKTLLNACLLSTCAALVMGGAVLLFAKPLLRIYEPNDLEAVKYGLIRLTIVTSTIFLCGIYDSSVSTLRGIGSSWAPTIIAVISIIGVRIVWIYTIFRSYHTLETLYVAWPLTWFIAGVLLLSVYFSTRKKRFARNEENYLSAPSEKEAAPV